MATATVLKQLDSGTVSDAKAAPDSATSQAAVWEELQKIQQEYIQRIQAATAAGNTAEVMQLVAEMNARIVEVQTKAMAAAQITVADGATQTAPVERSIYDLSLCQVNLNLIAYDGDRDIYFSLQDDSHFAPIAAAVIEQNPMRSARRHLLKNALKLSPTLAPGVYQVVERCRKTLGLNAEMEIYVNPSTDFNAACYPPVNGKFLLSFTSGLLEKFDQDELAFVMGHELGHALFKHYTLPVNMLLNAAGGDFSPLQVMRMFAWKRAAEISADRIGLLCAKNFDAAGRAFFKISSGVTNSAFHAHIVEYISQLTDLQAEMEGQEVEPEDWYSTHPFSPLRLKALEVFKRSETYLTLAGDVAQAELSEEQLEFEIKKLLSVMEPSYLQDDSKAARSMTDFLFYSGYLVAAANGVVEESELKALGSLLSEDTVRARMAEVSAGGGLNKEEDLKQALTELAKDLNVTLPIAGKLNVIKDLALIAGADGSVDETEKAVLYWACDQLNIRTEFVDHVLDSSQSEGM